jgi:tetratricopeptide (TPR) repeat protein
MKIQPGHVLRISLAASCLLLLSHGMIAQPVTTCDAQRTFVRADALLKQKQYDEAKALLAPLETCPKLSNLEKFNLSWFYGRARDFQAALDIMRTVPADVPDVATHRYALALGEFELGDYRSVVDTLKDVAAVGQLDADTVNLLAVSYSKLGLYKEGYLLLSHEIETAPQDRLAYLNLVALFADSSDYAHAVAVATQATSAFPNDPEMSVVLGAADTLQGNYKKAHDDFATAIRLEPQAAQPRFLLAVTDYKQRDFAQAASELKQAQIDGVKDSDLHYLLAECLSEMDPNNEKPVMTELDQAIELNSRNIAARTMRGRLLLSQHHLDRAIADLEIAHREDPNSHSASFALARAYNAAGRKEEAKALFAHLSTEFSKDLENQRNVEVTDEMNDRKLKDVLAGKASQ